MFKGGLWGKGLKYSEGQAYVLTFTYIELEKRSFQSWAPFWSGSDHDDHAITDIYNFYQQTAHAIIYSEKQLKMLRFSFIPYILYNENQKQLCVCFIVPDISAIKKND